MIPRKPSHKGFKTRGKRLNPRGKSNRSLDRQAWQREMVEKWSDVDYCEWFEGCGDTFGLANAHRLKKVLIYTQLEYVDGRAKLCQKHHDFAELGDKNNPSSHERMWELINKCMEFYGRYVPRQESR